jgi:hypothetical protein
VRSVAERTPHNNEIAVMTEGDYKIHELYDTSTYARRFTYRYHTARTHVSYECE